MNAIGRARTTNGHELPLNIKRSLIIGEYLHRYYHGRLYAKAQNVKRQFVAGYQNAFAEADVLAMPTCSLSVKPFHQPESFREAVEQTLFQGAAPDLGAIIRNTVPFNYTGHPAISVPCGLANGMPIGLQLVAPHFRDDLLLQVAHAYEQARSFSPQAGGG
jgi:amidase